MTGMIFKINENSNKKKRNFERLNVKFKDAKREEREKKRPPAQNSRPLHVSPYNGGLLRGLKHHHKRQCLIIKKLLTHR